MQNQGRASWRWLCVVSLGLIAGLAGCGSRGPYPVKGKLEYEDGQPVKELAGFMVTFSSESLGKSARGEIQADGSFRLTSNSKNDGAFPGEYKVIVSQPHPEPERAERRGPVVDLVYEDPGKTPLEAKVEAKNNEFTYKLKKIKQARK
jgi:hypothetical protein